MRHALLVIALAAAACGQASVNHSVQLARWTKLPDAWSKAVAVTSARYPLAKLATGKALIVTRPQQLDGATTVSFVVGLAPPRCVVTSSNQASSGMGGCARMLYYGITVTPMVFVAGHRVPDDDVPPRARVLGSELASAIDDAVNKS
jgi:hypothetical protein